MIWRSDLVSPLGACVSPAHIALCATSEPRLLLRADCLCASELSLLLRTDYLCASELSLLLRADCLCAHWLLPIRPDVSSHLAGFSTPFLPSPHHHRSGSCQSIYLLSAWPSHDVAHGSISLRHSVMHDCTPDSFSTDRTPVS